jgi:hypothetical protein
MHQNQWIGLQEKETKFYMWVKRQVENGNHERLENTMLYRRA